MAFQHCVVLVLTKSVQHSRDGDEAKKRALLSEIFVGLLNFIFKGLSWQSLNLSSSFMTFFGNFSRTSSICVLLYVQLVRRLV